MKIRYLHNTGGWKTIISTLFCLSFSSFVFSQTFTAKLLSANGESWGQTSHTEKTSKGNTVYIGDIAAATFNTTAHPYIKARLAYLSDDNMGSCSIRSIQRTTFEEGSAITSDPSNYFRRTCLSESYNKDWLDWSSDAAKTAAVNINTTYPEIVYAYSVADGDIYDVFFYVSDDSDPFVEGTCKKLFKVGPDEYEGKYEDLSGLAHWYFEDVSNLEEMFSQCGSLKKVGLSGDFSLVSSLKNMFYNCSSIEEIEINGDFGEKLTSLQGVFENCTNLKSITLGGDFKNVTNISSLFKNCTSLEEMSINGNFSTKLTQAASVFEGCESLESVSIHKAGEISEAKAQLQGDFSKVTNISNMFKDCTILKDVEIAADFSSLTSIASLLSSRTNLEKAVINGKFPTLTNVSSLFNGCTKLSSVDVNFETDALTNMSSMFKNCASITSATIGDGDEADVTVKGDFSKVTTLQDLFNGCSILEDVKIKEDFPLLTNIGSLFTNCPALKTVDIDGTFSSLTSLASLFSGKKNLEKVLINGSFDELTTMQETFKDCDKITTILFNTDGDADVKITGTFPKLETMNGMFRDCDKLYTASLEIPESVTTLNNLFKSSKLTSANVSNVGNVTTMESMFCACSNLTDVSLSGDFSNVETTKEMFNNATKVSNITLSGVSDTDTADFSSLVNVNQMFNNWTAAKDDVLADFMGQIIVDTLNLLGGFNNNYKINNNSSFTAGLAVKTANGMVYNVTSSDRNPSGKYLVFNSEATLLPIELSYFTLSQDGKDLFFEWETATETNNDYFTIEQSIDGVSFHEVARIAGAGTSSTSNYYEYSMLATFSGLMYFRLKQTDYNGDYSYSNIQAINVGNSEYIRLYPTIATDFITIEGDYESVKFSDAQGKIHHPTRMNGNSYPIAALPQGMHYAIISLKNGEIVTRQFFRK